MSLRGQLLWAAIAGFLLGVALRSLYPVPLYLVSLLAAAACALCAVAILREAFARGAFLASACLIFACLGIMRMDSAALVHDPLLDSRVGSKVVLEGVVSDEPDVREDSVRVPVRIRLLVDGTQQYVAHIGVLAVALAHTDVSYGQNVRIEGTLRLPSPFETGQGRQFDYPGYLAKDGIVYQISNARIEDIGGNSGFFPKRFAIALKHLYLEGLHNALPEPESALAGGITVGDKRSLGEDLSDTFRRVSLVHIVVLSGYNITIVINAVAHLLHFAPRTFRFGISGVVVALFILMTGGAASAVRAGAMALLAMYARLSGRTFEAMRALGVVALCMVALNPYTLLFDPSFQLSVLATMGLVLFTPLFAARMQWITDAFALREIAASTIGTQLAVLPLLLYQNGQLSLVSLPANLLALVPIPLAMALSSIASVAGMLFGSSAVIVGFPAYALLSYVIGVARILGSAPLSSVAIPAFSFLWVIAAYVFLFAGSYALFKRAASLAGDRKENVRG